MSNTSDEDFIRSADSGVFKCDSLASIPIFGRSLIQPCKNTERVLTTIAIIAAVWAIFVTIALVYLILKAHKMSK
jgi:hypothetical protein